LFKKQISHALLFKNVVWVVYLADILWCACYQAIFVFHARLRKNGWKFEAKITFHYVIMFSVLRIFLKKKKILVELNKQWIFSETKFWK